MARPLRLVTWNVWFKSWEREARQRALWAEIGALDPDVVCLQEVVHAHLRGPEIQGLRERGYWVSNDRIVDYDIVTLSRPVVASHERMPLPSVMGRELLVVRLRVAPPLTIASVHLESTDAMEDFRVRQLEDITAYLANEANVVLVGDMNFAPGAAPERALAGWRDAWSDLHPGEPGYTVDSDHNEMRALSKAKSKRARIDRVFIRADDWEVVSIERLGTRPLPDDPLTYPSDHFGLYAQLSARS